MPEASSSISSFFPRIRRFVDKAFLICKSYFICFKVQKLRRNIAGKDVLILGSAPNPVLPKYFHAMPLICCNGSAANASDLSLQSPVMTVVDYELIDEHESKAKDVRSVIIDSGYLRGLDLGELVATQSNDAKGGKPEILQANYSRFLEISRFERRRMIDLLTNTRLLERDRRTSLCSTGAFAVALAFYLGAKSVTLSGFTYFVSSDVSNADEINSINTRSHSMADSMLLGLATINGKVIQTGERDLLPVIQNYGNEGPKW